MDNKLDVCWCWCPFRGWVERIQSQTLIGRLYRVFSSMRFAAWEPDWLILTDTPSLISLGPPGHGMSPVPVSLFVLFVVTLVIILFACFVWSCRISAPGPVSIAQVSGSLQRAWLIIMGPLENVNGDSLLRVLYCQSSDLWTRENY